MKKYLVAIFIGIMIFGISAKAMAAAAASDVVCNGCIGTTDIAGVAVTEAKLGTSAVTNTKIANGAVTDAKITGPIAASKIEKPANVITVATSGGDFTTITAALASLPDPNTTPVLIKVMPGMYTEDSITMKSNVHLQGAGREVTIVDTQGGFVDVSSTDEVAITGLTIKGDGSLIRAYRGCKDLTISNNMLIGTLNGSGGVDIQEPAGGSQIITDNIITGFGIGIDIYYSSTSTMIRNNLVKGNDTGIWIENSNPTVIGNEITENQYGITLDVGGGDDRSATVSSNLIAHNTIAGINGSIGANQSGSISNNRITNNGDGIDLSVYGSAVITGNTLTDNSNGLKVRIGGILTGNIIANSSNYGVQLYANDSNKKISFTNNNIVNSGMSDILTGYNYGALNISLNVYDTFTGTGAVGAYNVKQDGTPAPLQ